MTRFDELADRLAVIAGEHDDLAFDRLREAAARGATQRPADDKALVQARRAVEKAAHLLRRVDGGAAPPEAGE